MLEMNPFTLDPKSGAPFPLDIRMELDDTAAFRWEVLSVKSGA
jgi:succinyl-CoA synthetase beta subunit